MNTPLAKSAEQKAQSSNEENLRFGDAEAAANARYDAMTPEERAKYYVKPSLWHRWKRYFGRA
jgi:hypothetical protein